MLVRSVQIAVLLMLSSLAIAQQKSRQHHAVAAPATSDCAANFTSGSGLNLTKYCVTENGNIVQFSRSSDEYLRVGDFSEGYGICDIEPNVSYLDYALGDSGNWQPATFSSTAGKAISTRITRDGLWQITNTISKVAANGSGPGAAKVNMQIKNLSGVSKDIILVRFADIDFSREGDDDFDNDFDYTIDTAIGLAPGLRTGLALTNNTFNFLHIAFAQSTPSGPDPCDPAATEADQPFFGDGSVVQAYGLTIPKNSAKTIVVTYKPI